MHNASATHNEPPTHHGGLENLDTEYSYWLQPEDGKLPSDLVGTFFRNGPGRQRIGDTKYGHWFDGDGMLCAFTFADGRAHFKNAYVRTPKYIAETAAQDICYRGFGTQIPGGLRANLGKMPANPANTNTMYHGGHLFALNEGGHPWELSPGDLSTIGEFNYDGALKTGQVFSAHGRIHPTTGDYINFGAGISGVGLRGPKPCIHMYRIGPDGKMRQQGQVPVEHFPFCHDFCITEHYALFFLGSITFAGMGSVMLGRKTIADVVEYDPSINMQVHIVDLNSLAVVQSITTDHGAVIHFGNAFERGDEIVVDAMFQDNFAANDTLTDVFRQDTRFGGGAYKRYTLNVKQGTISELLLNPEESEFPTFNPRYAGKQHSATYTACSVDNGANGFFNAMQKVDFEGQGQLITLPQGHYGSEPLFVPAQNSTREDDGYILEVVYDAYRHRSELQIYRADHFGDLVCRLPLQHHLPHQFHGYFVDQVFM